MQGGRVERLAGEAEVKFRKPARLRRFADERRKQLFLLLYKCWLVQKRHVGLLVVQVIVQLVIFALMHESRRFFKVTDVTSTTYWNQHSINYTLSHETMPEARSRRQLAYYPDTPLVKRILQRAVSKVNGK